MIKSFEIYSEVSKFPGKSGWYYVSVPEKYTEYLQQERKAWGLFPIKVKINNTSWKTKLMMKKGGSFFVAINKKVREKESIIKGERIKVNFSLM